MGDFDIGGLGTLRSSIGLGSGLDINDIVSKLVEVEDKAKTKKLDRDEVSTNAKITSYGSLKSALAELKDSLAIVKEQSKFAGRIVTVANDPTADKDTSFFTATANSSAVVSDFGIEISQLAKGHKLATTEFSTDTAVLGTGTLRFIVGAGQPNNRTIDITIDSKHNTLIGVKDAINARSADTGVSATMLTSDTGVKLVLATTATGVKNTLDIQVLNDSDGNDTDASALSQLAKTNLTELITPQDASIKIDGQTITSSTNTLVNTIDGVTLNLLQAEVGKTHTLKINADPNTATAKIEDFVTKYNELVDLLHDLTKYNPLDPKQNGELFGNPLINNLSRQLRDGLLHTESQAYGVTSLAAIGITSRPDNAKLEVDSTRIGTVISKHYDLVVNLFTKTNGVMDKLHTVVDNAVKKGGSISQEEGNLNSELKKIADAKLQHNIKMEKLRVELTLKYSRVDGLLGKLNQTSMQLDRALASSVAPLSFRKK